MKLNVGYVWNRSDYLLNDLMSVQYVKQKSGGLEITNNLYGLLSGDYRMTIGQTDSEFAAGRKNRVFYNNHYLNLRLAPHEHHAFTLANSLYRNNISGQKDQFFMDATYRYRVAKWRTDIEFTAQNLLNNDQYVQQLTSNIEVIQSYFELRPRQVILSTKFKF